MTINGELLREKYFQSGSPALNWASEIIEESNSGNYKVFSLHAPQKGFCTVLNIDTAFNIINSKFLGEIWDRNSAIYISNNSYLLTGKYYQDEIYLNQMGIVKVNINDYVETSTYIGKIDTFDWPGSINNLGVIGQEGVYYAGTLSPIIPEYYSYLPTLLTLVKLDTNLNVIWQRYYGGDACYRLEYLLTTADSGIVMNATRFDHTVQNNELDVLIFKVDAEGIITSMSDDMYSLGTNIIYPNPGSDKLYINSHTGAVTCHLLDLNGITIMTKTLTSESVFLINTSYLKPGLYLIQMFDKNNKILTSTKWVKIY